MESNVAQELNPGQVFFDYGPVSMVVHATRNGAGDTELCHSAFPIIDGCLRELQPCLEMLRRYPPRVETEKLFGTPLIMARAVLDTGDRYLTPMAAVAGSVADAVADYLQSQGAEKVTANNGGDVAVRLAPGQCLNLGLLYDLSKESGVNRVVRLLPEHHVGGVATSGLGGRSLTTGIASAVTVFSAKCANADALATLLANRSRIESAAIRTCKAAELDPDSDIADLSVVVGVEPLTQAEKTQALDQILDEAQRQYARGGLRACVATVQGYTVYFDPKRILS